MPTLVWLEDRYSGLSDVTGERVGGATDYGVRCLLPTVWGEVRAGDDRVQLSLPPLMLTRQLRIDADEDWQGTVTVNVSLPVSFRYTFRGRPVPPQAPATADAPSHPFLQRVELDGEVSVRMYRIEGTQTLTLPHAARAISLRRTGARQGQWQALRKGGRSRWEAVWDEGAADDLITVNGEHLRSPEPRSLTVEIELPGPGTYGVALSVTDLAILVRQLSFEGLVRGQLDAAPEGISVDIALTQ